MGFASQSNRKRITLSNTNAENFVTKRTDRDADGLIWYCTNNTTPYDKSTAACMTAEAGFLPVHNSN